MSGTTSLPGLHALLPAGPTATCGQGMLIAASCLTCMGPLCNLLVHAACRHHRYIFEEREKRDPGEKQKSRRVVARLQELGPRFTLKLRSMQKGTFDSQHGEFEWLYNHKQMDRSRKRFFI